jgi:hypothetical protein
MPKLSRPNQNYEMPDFSRIYTQILPSTHALYRILDPLSTLLARSSVAKRTQRHSEQLREECGTIRGHVLDSVRYS